MQRIALLTACTCASPIAPADSAAACYTLGSRNRTLKLMPLVIPARAPQAGRDMSNGVRAEQYIVGIRRKGEPQR